MSEYIFKLPDLGEGTVESEIGEWFIKVGDQVSEEDAVGTMMTDKAAVELSSPVSGKVTRLAGEPGDIVPVGAALVVFETNGAAGEPVAAEAAPKESAPSVAAEVAAKAAPTKVAHGSQGRVMTSPAVRRRAREAGIDLALVRGTGPGGRVTRQDFAEFVGAGTARDRAQGALQHGEIAGETKEIKVIGLRRIIAERMATAPEQQGD